MSTELVQHFNTQTTLYLTLRTHTSQTAGSSYNFSSYFIPIVFPLLWGKLTLSTRATAHGEVKIGDGGKCVLKVLLRCCNTL